MISVVIPVYNAAKYLAETVASVQAQTFIDWELILVDDGSKDNSVALAEALCRQDSRLSAYSQQNAGAAAARNTGLSKSRQEFPYALCLDSDDLLLPDALLTLLTLLEAQPKAPAVCGALQDIDSVGNNITYYREESLGYRKGVDGRRLVQRKLDAPIVFGDLCFRNHIVTPGQVLIRKSALEEVGSFDLSLVYIEDYDLWWRLAMQVGPILTTPQTVLLYRHHGSSLSSNRAVMRRGNSAFRWKLLTYPKMSSKQKQTAHTGYLYHCLYFVEVGVRHLKQGEIGHGLKAIALGTRNLMYYFCDLAQARKLDGSSKMNVSLK